jgi:HAD superfamily hydrolase (TIGR01484 family)
MRPITELDPERARALKGLLFDLDDTFLDHGRLTEAAYRSLFRLEEAGLLAIVVTGRPAAWGTLLVRQWPIAAAVVENGALSLQRDGKRVARLDTVDPETRLLRTAAVAALVQEVRAEFPELEPADDAGERTSDYTFDIGENRRADPALVERAVAFARARGAQTWTSSVHLHVTFDRHDKASGALRLLSRSFSIDATRARLRFAFIGDSENDASCFAAFETSIGVSNLSGRPTLLPRYTAAGAQSAGFVQAVDTLIGLRAQAR